MKRLWVVTLAAVLAAQVFAQNAGGAKDEFQDYKAEVNSGMGVLSQRIGDLENTAKLRFKGDLRLREEVFTQSQDNSPRPDGPILANGNIAKRSRMRVRFRFGAEKQIDRQVFAAFRLATGATDDPTSTNQTLGGQLALKNFLLDQAYVRYTPALLGGKIDVVGGKMANLLDISPITWDGDVNPEGVGAKVRLPGRFTATGHYVILNEINTKTAGGVTFNGVDPYLTNAQLARDMRVFKSDAHLMVGYEFVPWVTSFMAAVPAGFSNSGTNPSALNTPFSVTKNGMLGDASRNGWIPNLQMLEAMTVFRNTIVGRAFTWTFHAARNTNSFRLNNATTAGLVQDNTSLGNSNAYFAKLAMDGNRLNWGFQWGYIEPNAVLSLYSDSDSGAGYSNNKWFKADLGYKLTDNLTFNIGQYAVKRVAPQLLGGTPNNSFGGTSREPAYRTQADFVVKL